MAKDYLVVFTENGGRVEKDPEYISAHRKDINVLLNPEIPHGVPPQYWLKGKKKIEIKFNCPYKPIKLEPVSKLKKRLLIFQITTALLIIVGIINHVIH